jgi:hypothetical protein
LYIAKSNLLDFWKNTRRIRVSTFLKGKNIYGVYDNKQEDHVKMQNSNGNCGV